MSLFIIFYAFYGIIGAYLMPLLGLLLPLRYSLFFYAILHVLCFLLLWIGQAGTSTFSSYFLFGLTLRIFFESYRFFKSKRYDILCIAWAFIFLAWPLGMIGVYDVLCLRLKFYYRDYMQVADYYSDYYLKYQKSPQKNPYAHYTHLGRLRDKELNVDVSEFGVRFIPFDGIIRYGLTLYYSRNEKGDFCGLSGWYVMR